MDILKALEEIQRCNGVTSGHLITQIVKRRVSRLELTEALHHAQEVVCRLELLMSQLKREQGKG